jgi:hypothetical protein
MILTITVTSDDIKTGIPKDSCRCPIALAAMRAIRQRGFVFAFCDWLIVHSHDPAGRRDAYVLPARANAFMEAFDTGAGVAPFTFTTSLQEG